MSKPKSTPVGVSVALFPYLIEGILWTNRCDPAEKAKIAGDGQEPAPGVEEITIWVETPEDEPTPPERPRVDGWKANRVEIYIESAGYGEVTGKVSFARISYSATWRQPVWRDYSLTYSSLLRIQRALRETMLMEEKWEVRFHKYTPGWVAQAAGDRVR